ncbi:hypothetical protein RS130_00935 [Paraglaciecola aquimarina]|uniref:Uncharacterized protein n=1 Tax=Paraglaciecola aquimarina TaxID=1235557 RepID=A0ABU3SRQ9_9ALTE|nr:hypothetical protein [Paraglaciecola aquimarina]MDU0352668.1 hypothetical protein [Paraglaciecola aquimarina]
MGFTPQLGWQDAIDANALTLIPVATLKAQLQLLLLGRVDAAEVDYYVSRNQQQSTPEFNTLVFDPTLPHSVVEFKLSTIKQIKLVEQINHFILTHPSLVKTIKLRYGLTEPEAVLQQLTQSGVNKS